MSRKAQLAVWSFLALTCTAALALTLAQSPQNDPFSQKMVASIAEIRNHYVSWENALLSGDLKTAENEFATAFASSADLHREFPESPELNEFLQGLQETFEKLQRMHNIAILNPAPVKP